jgi:hypothetical protein
MKRFGKQPDFVNECCVPYKNYIFKCLPTYSLGGTHWRIAKVVKQSYSKWNRGGSEKFSRKPLMDTPGQSRILTVLKSDQLSRPGIIPAMYSRGKIGIENIHPCTAAPSKGFPQTFETTMNRESGNMSL